MSMTPTCSCLFLALFGIQGNGALHGGGDCYSRGPRNLDGHRQRRGAGGGVQAGDERGERKRGLALRVNLCVR